MSNIKQNNNLLNSEMLDAFFQEALESIETIESKLLDLSNNQTDQDLLDETFRLTHSLKGNAGFMEQIAIEKLAHAMENILSNLKSGSQPVENRTNHLLIEAADYLKQLICQETDANNPEYETILDNLAAEIVLLDNQPSVAQPGSFKADFTDDFFSSTESALPNNLCTDALNLLTELQKVIYQFDQPEHKPANSSLLKFAQDLQKLKKDLKSPTISALIHKSAVICDFYGNQKESIPPDLFLLLTDLTDLLDGSLLNLQIGNSPEIADLQNLLAPLDAELIKLAPKIANLLNYTEITVGANEKSRETIEKKNEESDKSTPAFSSFRQTDIRVNLTKLDQLLDLTGELVIAGSLITNSRKKGEEELEKAVEGLNRIIRDLQETTMNMRLLPFSILFGRMQKLVYSLAKKADKKVRLITSGEQTEVDKSLLEAVSDPLVHLIRNAVDHGIETESERIAANKSTEGTIRLEASLTGSEIQLLIIDDGKGMNLQKIRKKAIENKLILTEDQLSDDQLFNLIFLPGFSTAEKVTEISGRGVGMDVVKRNIEKIKGKIKISSTPGIKTEIQIQIPLTLTILEGLLIRTGSNQYIIPLDNITETFIVTKEEITVTPQEVEFIRKRNKLYALIRLHKLHRIDDAVEDLTRGVLLLVKSDDREIMLFIDEIIGQETTVIKSLPDYLGNLKTISGCAILGSGEVCQILHIPAIIEIGQSESV